MSQIDETNMGLQLVNIPYDSQLKQKQNQIENLFKENIKGTYKVNEIIGMSNPDHYRNKVHVVIGSNKKGKIIGGMYQENTHRIIPIESSVAHDKKADEIINSIKKILTDFKVSAYNEDSKSGLVRHILVRRAIKTNQTMLIIVTSSDMFPGRNNIVKTIRKVHPEINTIIQNINSRSTSVILGDKERVLFGKGFITDILCGLKFNISPKSFYQVNPIQTEILYDKAIECANLTSNDVILDAYCGIGTIGLIASKKVKEVIGVEVNNDAVKDAIKNARNNNIGNTRFYCADASLFMIDLIQKDKKVDVVFLDPPRSGCDDDFLRSLIKLNADKVIYISCNPETLVRDLKLLVNHNYKLKYIQPVDMFPHTVHVENVVLLELKR